jgi:HK97 family phage portal protein
VPWWAPWRRSPSDGPTAQVSVSDPLFAAMLRSGLIDDGAPSVTERTAMSLSAVFRAVSLGAGTIAALPLRTLKTNRDGTRERSRSWLDDPGFGQWTAFEWKELAHVHLWLHGNAYGQHVYNGGGALVGLNWIHPLAVEVERDDDAVGGRKYTVLLDDGTSEEFDALTLTHVPGISLDGLKGVSPITLARLSLGGALAGDKAHSRMMTSGAMISGLVTPDADEDLTQAEAETVKDTVTRAMTGVENAGQVAVINRKLRFQPWQLSAVDAQFMASRAFSIEEVGRWWGLPPHLLGQVEKQTSWGTGVKEQNRGLSQYTLQPWTTRFEQRMTRLLTRSQVAEFDYAQFLAPSPDEEIRLLLEQLNGGLMTANECRRVRNMPPVPDGDKLRIPAGAADPNAPAPSPSEEDAA